MTSQIKIFLTDEDARRIRQFAEDEGLKGYEYVQMMVLDTLHNLPAKPKKRIKYLVEYQERTRAEYGAQGSATKRRVLEIMRQMDGEPVSTPQLRAELGWKTPGSLGELLSDDDAFVKVDPPSDYIHDTRGRKPFFWVLASSSET